MVHKNQHISLIVKAITPETPLHWSITFHRPIHFQYDTGDWIDIAFDDLELTGGRTYSLSSSPTEQDLQITFKEGLSSLKRALKNVTPGDKLAIIQYGNDYGFQLRANKSSVLLAGGVGVAPFRSMLKELYDQDSKNDVKLIYLNQTDAYLFKPELEQWSNKLPNLSIHYITTKELNRKKREKLLQSIITSTNQQFYVAGPPGMVESTTSLLETMGVQHRDIKIDSFGGY